MEVDDAFQVKLTGEIDTETHSNLLTSGRLIWVFECLMVI